VNGADMAQAHASLKVAADTPDRLSKGRALEADLPVLGLLVQPAVPASARPDVLLTRCLV
jgi:hypothetical protein